MTLILLLSFLSLSLAGDPVSDLQRMAKDPPETQRAIDVHYLYGNEYELDLFSPYITNLGGVYVGVGAEQNYHLAAEARPDLMVLVDYDEMVVMVHMTHLAFLAASDDVDAFLGRYDPEQEAASLVVLEEAWGASPKWPKLQEFYPLVRETLSRVMRSSRKNGQKGKFLSFLSDDERYIFFGIWRARGGSFQWTGTFWATRPFGCCQRCCGDMVKRSRFSTSPTRSSIGSRCPVLSSTTSLASRLLRTG